MKERFDPYVPFEGIVAGVSLIIDTTECPIRCQLNATYSGYKKDHTFKYEIACQVVTGRICWAPFTTLLGPDSDKDVFYFHKLCDNLKDGEKILGDLHYSGLSHSFIKKKEEMTVDIRNVRGTIEHVIRRLKQGYHCLDHPWRHSLDKHCHAFNVAVHLTNIRFLFEPLHENVNKNLIPNLK